MTKYEKETIINYNEESNKAIVYTCSQITIRKLDKLCEQFPDYYKILKKDKDSKTYEMPKKLHQFRKPRILTEEQRKKKREMFIKNVKQPK